MPIIFPIMHGNTVVYPPKPINKFGLVLININKDFKTHMVDHTLEQMGIMDQNFKFFAISL